ncbi:hypothetical protein pipiens_003247 [Culex pipiens pipiens]|uniref:Chitin-binding type-2 domain-containing protein n=1 Tax=Culex pipiens pipiens TaxID=38569 RepID=A0ABD1D1A8_CULPP
MELGPVLLILLGQLLGILPQRCWRGPPSYLCPSAPTSLEVYLRHETYCSRFYKCIEGEAVEGICPLQEYFDPLSNTCLADESLCSRSKPRLVDVPGCEFCQQIFMPSESADQFFVCRYDGFGRAERCPRAVDLCTKVNDCVSCRNDHECAVGIGYGSVRRDYGDDHRRSWFSRESFNSFRTSYRSDHRSNSDRYNWYYFCEYNYY